MSSSSEQYPEEETTTTRPEIPQEDLQPLQEAVRFHHQVSLTTTEAKAILEECRNVHNDPAISPEEVAHVSLNVPKIRPDGGVYNPFGFLKKAIPKKIDPGELERLRALRAAVVRQEEAVIQQEFVSDKPVGFPRKCPKCPGQIVEYESGHIDWCKCGPQIIKKRSDQTGS